MPSIQPASWYLGRPAPARLCPRRLVLASSVLGHLVLAELPLPAPHVPARAQAALPLAAQRAIALAASVWRRSCAVLASAATGCLVP